MRVCLVSQEYPPETALGGIGTQTWYKAHALARLGHTVHVLSCAAEPGSELRSASADGVTVHRMQPPDAEFAIYEPHVYWLGYSWAVLRQLRRLLQSVRFDVIDFPDYGAEGFAFQLERDAAERVAVVVHLHGSLAMFAERIGWPERDSDFHRLGTFMEDLSIRRADGLIASSASIADFASRTHGVPRETIAVVHGGVDAETFKPTPEEQRPPSVLFVGNIALNKGVKTVLEAVLRLRAAHPDIRLQLLGVGDDDLASELKVRAAQEGAAASVEFVGFVEYPRLPEFYRRAQVVAVPSQYEGGVGLVCLEAMACGRPVVASSAGGAGEAVLDGETGLLVPPDEVEATAAALERLLGNPALRRSMGAAARRRVEEYYALDKYVQRVLEAYQETLARPRARVNAGLR